jgi:hypothetical protein
VVAGIAHTGGVARDGVGSKRVQPMPSRYSSGQEWASEAVTVHTPLVKVPGRNPIAMRAGIPTARDIITIAVAN